MVDDTNPKDGDVEEFDNESDAIENAKKLIISIRIRW